VYTFCLLFSYLIKVVALFYFICCYQHVLVNKDIQKYLKTRNAWQSLAYIPLSAVVSPPSEYEPRERTSDGQRRGALYHVLYNISNRYYPIRT